MQEERLPPAFAEIAKTVYLPLAEQVRAWRSEVDRPLGLAINGAQGTGKSTLAACLAKLCGLRTVVLSIDDLYLSQAARATLGHPLLRTRGVPGTHNAREGMRIIRELRNGRPVRLPRFDKSIDDPAPESDWPLAEPPVDVIILEGWCVGAHPQPLADLATPINDLERNEDQDGQWRHFVNQALAGDYQQLFDMFDRLIMLKAPSFECVYRWRGKQEEKLRARVGDGPGVMDVAALKRFIMHYERLTGWMLDEMPDRADVVLQLNEKHGIRAADDKH
jgi:D-glycerate 3-kinase